MINLHYYFGGIFSLNIKICILFQDATYEVITVKVGANNSA